MPSLLGLLMLAATGLGAEETNIVADVVAEPASTPEIAEPVATPEVVESTGSNEALRAYLLLQEQLHTAQLAIERTRMEVEDAAARSAAAYATQLRSLEERLVEQRSREARFIVWVLSAFAGLSFFAVVITAYFQWRTVNRLADLTTSLPALRATIANGTGVPELPRVGNGAAEQSSQRLLGAVQRLEERLLELERAGGSATKPAGAADSAPVSRPELASKSADSETAEAPKNVEQHPASGELPEGINELLARGQELLNDDNPEAALECFNRVLEQEPAHGDALVRKGYALEKLRRFSEAVECYDRAIEANETMTIAYLYKGGLYNRLERFTEAVECYEKALRTQEKRSAA